MLLLASGSLSSPNFDRILELVTQRGVRQPRNAFRVGATLSSSGNEGTELERLARVNDFFNRQIVFDDDMVIWNQADYWATPSETLGLGRGDCEDFVIAKYFTLRQLGLTSERLRLIYVRARTGTGNSGVGASAYGVGLLRSA